MAQLNNLIVTGSSRFLNKVYFSNGGTFNGNININNGELQIYGRTALMGYDSWLRINEPKHFTSGIYCGNGTLRTDGEFQVGDGGNCFKANSSAITCNRSLIVNAGVDFGYGATIRNAGLELYFSTPFIDFHFNNSNKDFTSRIIESKENVLSINGVTCSSSNLAANNVSATNVNVSSRINADAATAIFNNVYVKDELRSTTWAIDNITNLGSTFYVSPCIIFTNPSVYINSKSGTTVTLTITDNNIISSTIGGQTWTSGSKIKLMQSTDETVGLSPTDVNWAFWAGGTSMSTAKFRVNHAGVLYATGANISGNITATSGTIGGCSISNGKLTVPSANISGTLNASQIAANAITSDKINVSQLSAISANLGSITGGSIDIGGKFIVDSNGNFIATNGSLTGTVNATTMRAKQSISVYNDTFATYQDVVKWDGSNLSIGLVGNAGSTGVKGAQMAFSGSQISVGNSSIVCGSISGTNSSFTNVWAENFTNASTFKENITCNKNLKVKGDLTFADYQQDTLATASEVVYRRPIASAASNNSRVAFLQGASGNKISIRAQYGKSAFSSATFTASSSDIRLKEDIKDSSVNALSKIMQMQIREFNWKQTGVHQELGCVADELELIDPLLTVGGGYDKDGTMNIKSIDTLLLTEYAIKGIQELYSQNIQQQQRIEYLESQLNNR